MRSLHLAEQSIRTALVGVHLMNEAAMGGSDLVGRRVLSHS
jgi:hypothetical protein